MQMLNWLCSICWLKEK